MELDDIRSFEWDEAKRQANLAKAKWVTAQEKKAISIRLDDDIVEFFQATGKGYRTRINAVLRHFVTEQNQKKG